MSSIDWEAIIPNCKVTFSSLMAPDVQRSVLNCNVAEIVLPNGLVIDVEWDVDEENYRITAHRGDYENPIAECSGDDPNAVVEAVTSFAEELQPS